MEEEQRLGDDLDEVHGHVEALDVAQFMGHQRFELFLRKPRERAHGQQHHRAKEADDGRHADQAAFRVADDARDAET